jgi:selenocysteine lyase/cysteine desulfurase
MMNTTVTAAFPQVPGYLNTSTVGVPPSAAVAALHTSADWWGTGSCEPVALDATVDRARTAFASLVGALPTDIAIAGSVSQVVGMVAASLPNGARVLAVADDFSSVTYPFLTDPRLTVELVSADALIDSIRPGIDLVATSSARSNDGRVIDLRALAEAAHVAGVRTLVDATQSAGWLPIRSRDFDVVVAGGYKWLLTPRGVAFAAVRPHATWVRPVNASWYGADDPWGALYGPTVQLSSHARRLDTSPPWQIMEASAVSLELLASQDITQTFAWSVGLANELRGALGLPPSGSAIVAVPGDAAAVADAGIKASSRDGKVRLAFYLYNDEHDVFQAARALGAPALVGA